MRWPAQPVLIHVSFFLRHSVVWKASYELRADTIRIEDRIALSVGLCRVLASLPGAQRIRSFDEVSVCMHDLRKCSEKIQNQRLSQSQILSFQGSRQMEQFQRVLLR